jgi:hypothetical protein
MLPKIKKNVQKHYKILAQPFGFIGWGRIPNTFEISVNMQTLWVFTVAHIC